MIKRAVIGGNSDSSRVGNNRSGIRGWVSNASTKGTIRAHLMVGLDPMDSS